jgi:hypothetical protein
MQAPETCATNTQESSMTDQQRAELKRKVYEKYIVPLEIGDGIVVYANGANDFQIGDSHIIWTVANTDFSGIQLTANCGMHLTAFLCTLGIDHITQSGTNNDATVSYRDSMLFGAKRDAKLYHANIDW